MTEDNISWTSFCQAMNSIAVRQARTSNLLYAK